jgi:hypothetical protein
VTPNLPVWYAYSVSQIRFGPNARRVSSSRRSSVAIVIVRQAECVQPPANGESVGRAGYGWCA